jgi:predicted ArsR family transcriptional regulator
VTGTSWHAVAALVDPLRRALFEHVRRVRRPVTREDAAEAAGISRSLTAFHLDKLVDAGLLRARYEAPPDQHRGRGRTPKVYEPTDAGVSVVVPPRQYELLASILAEAMEADATSESGAAVGDRARDLAFDYGRQLADYRRRTSTKDPDAVLAALDELGFEPRVNESVIILGNCPFHSLATRQPELICGLNHSLISGMLAGSGAGYLQARLEPRPHDCCVQITRATPA